LKEFGYENLQTLILCLVLWVSVKSL
jgi:hypothetical protein